MSSIPLHLPAHRFPCSMFMYLMWFCVCLFFPPQNNIWKLFKWVVSWSGHSFCFCFCFLVRLMKAYNPFHFLPASLFFFFLPPHIFHDSMGNQQRIVRFLFRLFVSDRIVQSVRKIAYLFGCRHSVDCRLCDCRCTWSDCLGTNLLQMVNRKICICLRSSHTL